MRDYKLSLTGGVPQQIKLPKAEIGELMGYHLVTAASDVTVRVDDGAPRARAQGLGEFGLPPFEVITLESASAQDIVIAVGAGGFSDSRATFTGTIGTTTVIPNAFVGAAAVTIPATTSGLLLAADAARHSIRLSIQETEAGGVFIGDNLVSPTTGGWMAVGSVEYIDTSAAIYAYNPNGASVTIGIVSVKEV